MSEAFNAEQINLLLQQIENMEKDKQKDKSVKVYDFFMPNKFSKERIKILAGIFENYARALSMYMSSTFRVGCSARVNTITEKRYKGFMQGFVERELMGVIDIHDDYKTRSKEKIVIKMPNKFCLFVYVKLLGDSGDRIYTDKALIGRSEIECSIIEYFLSNTVPHLTTALSSLYPCEFNLGTIDNNPKISQVMNENVNVVDIQIDLMLAKLKQSINICVPASFLDDVFDYIEKNNVDDIYISDESNEDNIMSNIEDSKLEIRTVLDNIELTLGDVYSLQPGDIIQLDKMKDEDVLMYIGDKIWFSGTLGTSNNNVAVKINDVVRNVRG